VLTPLQERIAVLVAASLEGSDFALAGGAALISQGLVDRKTGDLDFFGSSEQVLAERLPEIISALEQDGMIVEVRRSTDKQNMDMSVTAADTVGTLEIQQRSLTWSCGDPS
jgi:hypothetical protein